jgi:hypothetical protein
MAASDGGDFAATPQPGDAAVSRRSPGYLPGQRLRSGSACEIDEGDSDGQGAPQGGGAWMQSTPVSARAADILRGLRGLEAIIYINLSDSFKTTSMSLRYLLLFRPPCQPHFSCLCAVNSVLNHSRPQHEPYTS